MPSVSKIKEAVVTTAVVLAVLYAAGFVPGLRDLKQKALTS